MTPSFWVPLALGLLPIARTARASVVSARSTVTSKCEPWSILEYRCLVCDLNLQCSRLTSAIASLLRDRSVLNDLGNSIWMGNHHNM